MTTGCSTHAYMHTPERDDIEETASTVSDSSLDPADPRHPNNMQLVVWKPSIAYLVAEHQAKCC